MNYTYETKTINKLEYHLVNQNCTALSVVWIETHLTGWCSYSFFFQMGTLLTGWSSYSFFLLTLLSSLLQKCEYTLVCFSRQHPNLNQLTIGVVLIRDNYSLKLRNWVKTQKLSNYKFSVHQLGCSCKQIQCIKSHIPKLFIYFLISTRRHIYQTWKWFTHMIWGPSWSNSKWFLKFNCNQAHKC